jgi:hypothetical protein
MKKNFKITGFSALIFFNILYSIQCLLVCGAMKLLTLILPINLELTVVTFVVIKAFQIIGYSVGFRWE